MLLRMRFFCRQKIFRQVLFTAFLAVVGFFSLKIPISNLALRLVYADTINIIDFTALVGVTDNYSASATGVAYTFTFALPAGFAADSQNNFGLSLDPGNTNSELPASFCDATEGTMTDNGVDMSSSISLGANSADANGRCSGMTLYIADTYSMDTGDTVVAQLLNVTNPGTEGAYYPDVTVMVAGNPTHDTLNSTSIPKPFGTPLINILVTEPDGTTAVEYADVWVHTDQYNKSVYVQTGTSGYIYLFSNAFWLPSGQTVDDTYTLEVQAPSGGDYTDAVAIRNISLAEGSTLDYTTGPLGPIKLTTPLIKGTVVVPASPPATCNAVAGDTIPDIDIDIRDAAFNPMNFKNIRNDSNGIFRVGGLGEATYLMEIRTPWNMTDYEGLIAPDNIEFEVTDSDDDGTIDYVTYNSTTTPAASFPLDLGNVAFQAAKKTISGTITKDTGEAVTGAKVMAFKMMGSGMAETDVNNSGEYSLMVGGGNWMVMPEIDRSNNYDGDSSNDVTADWIYCGMPKSVTFASDSTTETSSGNDFTVRTSDATITGYVKDPEGGVRGSVGVNIFSKDGCGTPVGLDYSTGYFYADVPAGTYTVSVQIWDGTYGPPAPVTMTVSSGTASAGTLTLSEKQASISGRLWADANDNGSYDSGEGVANTRLEAFKVSKKFDEYAGGPGGTMGGPGGDWAAANSSSTDATKGDFEIKVTKGTWILNVMADMGMMGGGYSTTSTNYIYTGSPVQVNISTDDATSTGNNFLLEIADATIVGRVVNSETGVGISGVWGYAFAEPSGTYGQGPMMGMGMGAPINNSSFTIKVPAGSYKIGVDFPPETSGYTPSSMATVTAVSGTEVSVDVNVVPNNATVTINFVNDAGSAITDLLFAEVFMDNGEGGHQWRMLSGSDLTTGSTNILVAAGVWNVGYFIDPSTTNYMSQPVANNKVTTVANQTVSKNIALKVADSTVSGTAKDPSGNPLAGVFISTDSRKASTFNPMGGPMFSRGEMTGADGAFSLLLPAGTYKVSAFFPPIATVGGQTVNYLNPAPQEVTISSAAPTTANFTFEESDATISGTITLDGSNQGAFVAAYSDGGGYNETTSTNGSYSLSVTSDDTWYVKAMYENDTTNAIYFSSVYEVAMAGATSKTQDMTLTEAPFTIPDAVSTTFNCANAKKISLTNGAEISIPASAVQPASVNNCNSQDSDSNITVTITPTAQMSLQDQAIPVGVGYEITAKDSNGSAISDTFNSNVTLVIPYTAAMLNESVGVGADETLLGNGYWDTASSTWKTVDNQTLDTTENTLTVSTNHFTLFGVISAGDPDTSGGGSSSSSSSDSSSWSSGDDENEGTKNPYLNLSSIGDSMYDSTKYYYFHPGGNLKITGTAHEKTRIRTTVDGARKYPVYMSNNVHGDESSWEFILYDPIEGHEYKFDMYAETTRGKASVVRNFYVKIGNGSVYSGATTGVAGVEGAVAGVTVDDFVKCSKTHEIEVGDTLWALAETMLGSSSLYPAFINVNPDLSNPSVLNVGNTLNVPCRAGEALGEQTTSDEDEKLEKKEVVAETKSSDKSAPEVPEEIESDGNKVLPYAILAFFLLGAGGVLLFLLWKR